MQKVKNTGHGTRPPSGSAAEIQALERQLRGLSSRIDSDLAGRIDLLIRFDRLEGWRASGAKNCVAWMNSTLGINPKLAREYLRVGRTLRGLPELHRLFLDGSLSWSKTRLLTRVADRENEKSLAAIAVDAPVSDVERVCQEFRWANTLKDEYGRSETARAAAQYQARSLRWYRLPGGNFVIRLELPTELAQNYLKGIEHCEDLIFQQSNPEAADPALDSDLESPAGDVEIAMAEQAHLSYSQRRADAAVMMAERSLVANNIDIARADRYQVVLHIDAHALGDEAAGNTAAPQRRPLVDNLGPVSNSTARRLTCDARLMSLVSEAGEPVSIGRLTRIWPAAIRRAILARDRHCQFPGCTTTRHLDIHHVVHWADGGETSLDNGCAICRWHHTYLHEGGYRLQRVPGEKRPEATSAAVLLPTRSRFRLDRGSDTALAENAPAGTKNPDRLVGS